MKRKILGIFLVGFPVWAITGTLAYWKGPRGGLMFLGGMTVIVLSFVLILLGIKLLKNK